MCAVTNHTRMFVFLRFAWQTTATYIFFSYNCSNVASLLSLLILTHVSASVFLRVFLGGLGAVRRRLRWVVPPGVRGRVVRNGRERGLHLHRLLPESRRGERGRHDRGGGGWGERCSAGDVAVRCGRCADSAIVICRDLVVSCLIRLSSKPSDFTSAAAAARASAGQLALKNKQPRTEIEYCTSHNEHNTKPSIQASVLTSAFKTEGPNSPLWMEEEGQTWAISVWIIEQEKWDLASGRPRREELYCRSVASQWHVLSPSAKICWNGC